MLTTCKATTPSPNGIDAGTLTVIRLEVTEAGFNGPSLTVPEEVATKKLTIEPEENPIPDRVKRLPTNTGDGTEVIEGAADATPVRTPASSKMVIRKVVILEVVRFADILFLVEVPTSPLFLHFRNSKVNEPDEPWSKGYASKFLVIGRRDSKALWCPKR